MSNFVELAYNLYTNIPSVLQCWPFKGLHHICYTAIIIVIRKNPYSCLSLNFSRS